MLCEMLENVRKKAPLVHNITNYVTVNDCANMVLACGASPIMADDPREAAEITALCSGLNINIGTLNSQKVPAMLLAGQTANRLGLPAVLDPVGAGASRFRTETALQLIEAIHFSVIRGNISEIRTLAIGMSASRGVDAAHCVTEDNLSHTVALVQCLAERTGAVITATGAIDIVSDGRIAYCIHNGRPEMSRITGTGCQLSALTAAFLAANPDHLLQAAAAAACTMGLAGEIAWGRMASEDGNATYRNRILDAVCHMDGKTLQEGARYEIR